MIEIILDKNQANRRFDRFLHAYLSRATKSLIHKLLRKKRIKLNGKRAEGNETTAIGDRVTFYLAPETLESFKAEPTPPAKYWGPVDIIYEDENILLANKPAGLLSHPNKSSNQDSLASRIKHHLNEGVKGMNPLAGGGAAPHGLANRLDRNTSGLVACGKNMAAMQALSAIFAERRVEKIYLAVVHGRLEGRGDLRGYLRKDEKANRSYIADTGSPVRTEYECLKAGGEYSLLRVILHTGRPHQIRAHLADIGHPLAGDIKYGGVQPVRSSDRLMLHCRSLRFLETEGHLAYLSGREWKAPVPEEFIMR